MSTQYKNLSSYNEDEMPDKKKVFTQQYAIVVADWNPQVTQSLLQGTYDALIENGANPDLITIIHVPGTFELIFAAKQFMDEYSEIDNIKVHKYAAIIALGCVIQGETPHFAYVCQGVTYGIATLNANSNGCPVIFGILTTQNLQQALDRAGGLHGNKGFEAGITAIKMANIDWHTSIF
ncbi:MAG TPA: 6,7-dimethyl-8-ribityllumazine synthase [Paludibacteraceae bacterium]|nr:6,7-dimethyl-8-ribityllumazine synthase [Paludibacteraceae bacterium]